MIRVQPGMGKMVLDDLGVLHVLPSVSFRDAVKKARGLRSPHPIVVHQVDPAFPFLQAKVGGTWRRISPRW